MTNGKNDIAPGLLEDILHEFDSLTESDKSIDALLSKIRGGKATYADVYAYAEKIGGHSSTALLDNITADVLPEGKMYFNIAQRTVRPVLEQDYDLIADAAEAVQQNLNEADGIGLNAVRPEMNEDRISGLIDKLTEDGKQFDDVKWALDAPVTNFCQSVADDSVKANAEFHYQSGMTPVINRITDGKCCKWCSRIAGKYKYPDVPQDVYRRHENCGCTVLYDPGNGKYQDVHSKREFSSEREAVEAKLEKADKNKVIEMPGENDIIQKGNVQVREWYIEQVSKIRTTVDDSLQVEEQAKKAFEERNRIRTEARAMMADKETRAVLEKERPNLTFEELIASKMQRKGLSREEAVLDILKTATKTNEKVNIELGLEG